MKKIGFIILGICLCIPSLVSARSLRSATKLWESATVHQAVLAYVSLGTLNDMVRGRRLSRARARKILRMLKTQLERELRELKQLRVYGGRQATAFARQLQLSIDFLLQAANAFDKYLRQPINANLRSFLTFRNAAVRDVAKVLRHRGRRSARSYRGGWKIARFQLSNSVARELALGYVTVGLLGDVYFKRLFSNAQVLGFLKTTTDSLNETLRLSARVARQFRGRDRTLLLRFFNARSYLIRQAAALRDYIKTRKRSSLRKYTLLRRQAWATISVFAR